MVIGLKERHQKDKIQLKVNTGKQQSKFRTGWIGYLFYINIVHQLQTKLMFF